MVRPCVFARSWRHDSIRANDVPPLARMPRPQFSIRTLLWLTLVVVAFLGGMLFERERQRRMAKPYNVGHEIQWTF